MFNFQQKRQIRKVLYSRVTLFFLFIIVIFLARATYAIYAKEKLSADDYASVEKSYDALQAQNAMLGSQIAKLGTPAGEEEEIRDKFSVAKPGETVVMVIASTDSSSIAATSTGLWQKFLGLFK